MGQQIDQPVGTGFSWADSLSDYAKEEDQVAIDLYEFLQIFLQRNPKYAKLPFFITGYVKIYEIYNRVIMKDVDGANKRGDQKCDVDCGLVVSRMRVIIIAILRHTSCARTKIPERIW